MRVCHLGGNPKLIAQAFAGRNTQKELALQIATMPQPFTVHELAAKSNTRPESCRKALTSLQALGIAIMADDKTWTVDLSDEALNRVIKKRGTGDLPAKRKALHAEHREHYRRALNAPRIRSRRNPPSLTEATHEERIQDIRAATKRNEQTHRARAQAEATEAARQDQRLWSAGLGAFATNGPTESEREAGEDAALYGKELNEAVATIF